MTSLAGSAWRRIVSQVWQCIAPVVRRIRERLHDTPQLRHIRLSMPYVVGIGVGLFFLPYVLWWLTATSRNPAPPRTLDGIEINQLITALQTAMVEPVVGRASTGAPVPFSLRDVEVELHFVVQHSAAPGDASLYRLVPVDTALQARPEHVQTLKMRLLPTLPLPSQAGTPGAVTATPRAAEDVGMRKPVLLKKRDRS